MTHSRNLHAGFALFVALMLLLILVSSLEAQGTASIGVYFDPMGTECSGTIAAGQPGTVYVIAKSGDMALAGAEFRFAGIPDSWSVYPVAHSEILALGDPFGEGVSTAFPCLLEANSSLTLYEVLVLATSTETDVEFQIEMRNPPLNPNFQCPALLMCNEPIFSYFCVEGISCHVNSSSPRVCTLAVEDETWSVVKGFYR